MGGYSQYIFNERMVCENIVLDAHGETKGVVTLIFKNSQKIVFLPKLGGPHFFIIIYVFVDGMRRDEFYVVLSYLIWKYLNLLLRGGHPNIF